MGEAWIIDAARTPRGIGKPGKGALSEVHPQRILSTVLKALAERNGMNTAEVDDVIAGCGSPISKQGGCVARMAALDAGYSVDAPGVQLSRFCGSALTAVNLAAMGIMSGQQDLVVAGGVEQMSMRVPGAGSPFLDGDNADLRARYPQPHQGVCADLIATLDGISREDADKLALESQRRADIAIKNNYFKNSVVPVYHPDGRLALDKEEFPRPQTTLEGLSSLQPSFAGMYGVALNEAGESYKALVEQVYPGVAINHIHHAGNSSGVVDGASGVVLASPDYAKAQGWKPRARVIMTANAGDSPTLMLTAPTPAVRKVLKKAKMTLKDIDLIEINEAFAAIPLKVMRDLDMDPDKVNVNGGAMALGHPIGATGAMLVGTVLDELERRGLSTGLVTMCTGGGMAPALIIERI